MVQVRVIGLLAAASLLLVAPAIAFGEPLFTDAQGDVMTWPGFPAQEPWRDGVDIVAVWVHSETEDEVRLSIGMKDVSQLEDTLLTAPTGAPFWSYTDFVAGPPGGESEHTLYIDLHNNPLYTTGWRFYLRADSGNIDVEGVVDTDISAITVTFPRELIGAASVGDRMGDFRISTATTITYPLYSGDWAPDSGTCECYYVFATGPMDDEDATAASATGDPVPASGAPSGSPPPASSPGTSSTATGAADGTAPEAGADDASHGARAKAPWPAALSVVALAFAARHRHRSLR